MKIISYHKLPELDVLLKAFPADARFIVPSRRDKDWWRVRTGQLEYGFERETPIHLWNWDDLYKSLCFYSETRPLRQIDPPDHRLILYRIVADFLKERRDLVDLWPGLARPGFLDVLSDDIRELINEDVSVDQLEPTLDTKPTSCILPQLYRRYLEYLDENMLMDSAQIPLKARELLDRQPLWCGDSAFIFAGFLSFTHGQSELVRRLEKCAREVVLLKPETDLRNFQDATSQFQFEASAESPLPFPPSLSHGKIVSIPVSDSGAEAEALARNLALWHGGEGVLGDIPDTPFPGFGSIGMMVSQRQSPSMEAALRRYGIPYTLAKGRPISSTSVGTLTASVWTAWIQGLEAYETSLLLAHPGLAGMDFPIDDAVASGPSGIDGWERYLRHKEEKAEDPHRKKLFKRASKSLKAIAKFCRTLEKGHYPSEILNALHLFLTAKGLWLDALAVLSSNNTEIDEDIREMSLAIAEVESKRTALQEMQPDLGAAGKTLFKGKDAVDFLKNWGEAASILPPYPVNGTLSLHFAPPATLASYPVWIIADATQKNWPGSILHSPLLDAERRLLIRSASAYLPSAHDKRMQKEALFRRLVQTGENLTVVSYSVADAEGRPAAVTPFLKSFLEDMKLWENETAPVVEIEHLYPGENASYFPEIEAASATGTARGMPKIKENVSVPLRFPVSDLQTLLECPLRYWLQRRVRLREKRSDLWNRALAGQLAHLLWENVWRRKTESGASISVLAREEWSAALSLKDDYEDFASLLKDRRVEIHVRNMAFYIERLAKFQQDVLDRLALADIRHSRILMEDDLSLEYETGGVLFTGRCDRIEVFDEKHIVVTDYKLGRSTSYESPVLSLGSRPYLATRRSIFRYGLQLSAYALMLHARHPGCSVSGVGFLGHKDGALSGTFESPFAECYMPDKKARASIEERMKEAQEALQCAARILNGGLFEPCYIADTCRYCDMKGICRKGELRGEALGHDPENEYSEEESF